MTVSLLAQYRIYDEYPTYPDFRQLSSTRPLINQPRPARPFKRLENLLLAAVADIDLALIDGGAGGEGGHTPDFLGVGEGLAGGGFGGEGCGWGPCGEVSEGGAAAEGEAWDVHCDLFFPFFFVRDICGGGCHILNNSNRQLVTPPLINAVPIFELGH